MYLQVDPSLHYSVVVKQTHGLRINRDSEGRGELVVHHKLDRGLYRGYMGVQQSLI